MKVPHGHLQPPAVHPHCWNGFTTPPPSKEFVHKALRVFSVENYQSIHKNKLLYVPFRTFKTEH